jgi:DNA (cytosine-5)-methyltransferase 1
MFAGYGGASFSLKKVGIDFECVGYSEINKDAMEIYNLNHTNTKNYGDCSKIKVEELSDFDLLTGGFPCQPFSVNTNSKARGKGHKDYNLFKDILRILEYKKPKYFLLENVKGIKGEKSKEVFETIQSELRRLGYGLKVVEVNSKDYGTPQNRERVLFIGKYGVLDEEVIRLPEIEQLEISVLDLLEKGVSRREPKIKRMKLSKKENIKKFGEINRLDVILKNPVNKRNSNVAFEILDAPSNVVSRQSDRIYHPTYSPCLTATGSDYLFYVDKKVIVLTPKECFRLMGFFNDEINTGNLKDNSLHRLAGNGWDVNTISKFIKNLLLDEQIKIDS